MKVKRALTLSPEQEAAIVAEAAERVAGEARAAKRAPIEDQRWESHGRYESYAEWRQEVSR